MPPDRLPALCSTTGARAAADPWVRSATRWPGSPDQALDAVDFRH